MATLETHGLVKHFRGSAVVDHVDLRVNSGEIVGLLGPNGAGKTTCFYMICGLIRRGDGLVQLDNADVGDLPMHARARLGIGYLPQEPSIFRRLTVEQNILAVLEALPDLSAEQRLKRADAMLSEFGIAHKRDAKGYSLSGGERRRVEIARALASRPSFMLLDEPFTGIDPLAVSDISDLVGYLKQRGLGVLITDHQVRETLQIVDRASIIYDGGVLFEGVPDDVLTNEDVRRVYLGERFAA